jgi:hypothetical protein
MNSRKRTKPACANLRRALTLFAALLLLNASASCAIIEESVHLGIPDRAWDPGRPDLSVGWCAEACIQMALAYYGLNVTQAEINSAGDPDHPDLYAYEVDHTLGVLGTIVEVWDEDNSALSAFAEWIKNHLQRGHPVLLGVKIHPDEHPSWSLDHFVLAVGYTDGGLILNTQLDLDGQILVDYEQLQSRHPGYSFNSQWNEFFGRAILGIFDNGGE